MFGSYHPARLTTEPRRHELGEADTYTDETVRYHRQSNTVAAYSEYPDGTAGADDSHTEQAQAASSESSHQHAHPLTRSQMHGQDVHLLSAGYEPVPEPSKEADSLHTSR